MKSKTIMIAMVLITALVFGAVVPGLASASVAWLSSIAKDSGIELEAPTRLAVDAKGNVYATDPRDNKNRVVIFDREGRYKGVITAGLSNPKGIAVDGAGRIYVGNSNTGSVSIYNPDLTLAKKIGKGDGEFLNPTAIAVSSTGKIYVVDGKANTVKVYNQDGTTAGTFGGYGQGNGQLNTPLGIAIDDGAERVYVTDCGQFLGTDGMQGGARVQVFDLAGAYKTYFGQFGSGPGQMMMPSDITLDSGAGMVYITDANQYAVHVFTTSGTWVETLSDSTHLKTPLGIALGKDRRLFVASSNGRSIEVYALPGYTTMSVTPKSLTFTTEAGANPAPQNITITNSGSGNLAWTAQAATADGHAWLLATPSGTAVKAVPSLLSVTPDIKTAGLGAGTYTGTLTVAAPGAEEKIAVQLVVAAPPAILSVAPTAAAFKAQQGGADPAVQAVSINNLGSGALTWSATTTTPTWLKLGITPPFLNLAPTITGLVEGMYESVVTITAAGAQGSPAAVSVKLQVIKAGTLEVNTNLANGAFDITGGPFSYTNLTGKTWSNDEVIPGDYTVTFKRLPGYTKPAARKVTIVTGKKTSITGEYRKKPAVTHIIAGSADTSSKDMQVAVVPLDLTKGSPVMFTAFTNADSVRVAAGDLDNSGSDKIVVTDHRRTIKVYTDQGGSLATYDLPDGTTHADVMTADLDNDGAAEIIVGAEQSVQPRRAIRAYTLSGSALVEKAVLYTEDKEGRFAMAQGDLNDDGMTEVFVADGNSVRAFSVQQTGSGMALAQLWTKNGDFGTAPQLAAGDLNGDGMVEVAISYDRAKETRGRGKDKGPVINVLKGTGEDYGVTIEAFKDLGYTRPSTIVLGDTDGDLVDEVIAGAGPAEGNDPVVRIFESDGAYAGITMKPLNGRFGTNAGLGGFQQ